MNDKKAWERLNDRGSEQLFRHVKIEGRISIAEDIYQKAKQLIGCVERKATGQKHGCSRKEMQIREVRSQIHHLTKQVYMCEDKCEKGGLLGGAEGKKESVEKSRE